MREELSKKIDRSIHILQKMEHIALKYRDFGFIGAFSGGKDSQVIHGLLDMAGVAHINKYNWTTIDPPEVYHFITDNYPDVIIQRPTETFWQLVMRHGILPNQFKRFCCRELKETKDYNCVVVTGVRHEESPKRKKREEVEIQTRRRHPDYIRGTLDQFSIYKETHVDCISGKDRLIVNPIIDWTEQDVWEFIRYIGKPSCVLYSRGYSRVGCMFCPMASRKKLYKMIEDYPKYYQAFVRLIHRLRQLHIDRDGYDKYGALTDEEVFFAWINKISYKKALANKCQTCIPFK